MRASSSDAHFNVEFSVQPISDKGSPFLTGSWYRAVMRQANCGIQDAKLLPHNVGFIKLNSFPDPAICADMAAAALRSVSHADALIFDLRDNSGGSPKMVRFLAGRLFDKPVFLYNPRESSARAMWTSAPAENHGFFRRPVFVLTSSRTNSAAEEFSYNLKMLHRATIVGERTAGATDTGIYHRIDEHFGIALRESSVPNPYPTPDWSAVGVQPDVPTSSADALRTAQALAVPKESPNP